MRFSAVARPSLSVAAIKFEKSYIRLSSSTALATAKDEPSYKGQAPKPGVNFFYVLLGLGGVGLAGAMLWGTGTALFSQSSAHRIQARAVEKLEQNDEVKANIGTPFSVGQVTSLEYQKEGRDVRVPVSAVLFSHAKVVDYTDSVPAERSARGGACVCGGLGEGRQDAVFLCGRVAAAQEEEDPGRSERINSSEWTIAAC